MRELKENEYVEDGQIFCSVCKTTKTFDFDGQKIEGNCQCVINRHLLEQKEKDAEKLRLRIEELKKNSDLGEKFRDVTFDRSEKISEFKPCIDYCKQAGDNYRTGKGMYLHGLVGRGKTHTMACMLNVLAGKLYVPYFTSFNNIARDIKSTYNRNSKLTEEDVYWQYTQDYQFLFIDDVGTEYASATDGNIQRVIFDIINKRYNDSKPIIFSSNLAIKNLSTAGIDERVIHRIYEMCKDNVVEFKGRNFRV